MNKSMCLLESTNIIYRIRNLLRKGDNLLSMREGTFQDETNPALTLINMAKESAKYKTRLEEIKQFNEVTFPLKVF